MEAHQVGCLGGAPRRRRHRRRGASAPPPRRPHWRCPCWSLLGAAWSMPPRRNAGPRPTPTLPERGRRPGQRSKGQRSKGLAAAPRRSYAASYCWPQHVSSCWHQRAGLCWRQHPSQCSAPTRGWGSDPQHQPGPARHRRRPSATLPAERPQVVAPKTGSAAGPPTVLVGPAAPTPSVAHEEPLVS